MLLPENVPEFAVCDTYDSGTRKGAVFAWRGLIQRLRIPFMIRRPKATPEAQLAQMLMTVQGDTYIPVTNPTLIERVEAQLGATDDAEVRKLFAKYLSEP